jgi:hypothetical protein
MSTVALCWRLCAQCGTRGWEHKGRGLGRRAHGVGSKGPGPTLPASPMLARGGRGQPGVLGIHSTRGQRPLTAGYHTCIVPRLPPPSWPWPFGQAHATSHFILFLNSPHPQSWIWRLRLWREYNEWVSLIPSPYLVIVSAPLQKYI